MGPCPSLSLGSPPPQQHNNRELKTGGWLLKWPWTSKFWILGADSTFELQTSNYEQMEKSNCKMQDGSSTWPQYCLQEEYWGGIKLTFLLQVLEHQCHWLRFWGQQGYWWTQKEAEVNNDNNDEPCPFPSLPVALAQGQNVHTTARTNLQYLYLPSVVYTFWAVTSSHWKCRKQTRLVVDTDPEWGSSLCLKLQTGQSTG